MQNKMIREDRRKMLLLIVVALSLIAAFLLIGLNPKSYSYALGRRISKVYAIVLVGGAIGFSSLIFQTVTNNHILTPSILGLDSLYMLANTVMIFVLGSTSKWITNAKMHFGLNLILMLIASAVFYKIIFKNKNGNIFFMLLVGVIVGTLFESFTTFLQVLIDPSEFLKIQDKSQASFNQINTEVLGMATVLIVGGFLYSFKFLGVLDVMALGRDQAINLGVNYESTVGKMLIVVVILTAAATALVGPITFLGILIVNIARYFIKSFRHRHLALAIWLFSIIFLVGGQLIAERVLNFGVSVGIIINFVGGVYFIYLLMKGRAK